MTNKTPMKSRDQMVSLSAVDLRIIECAEFFLNMEEDSNACKNLWEQVTKQMWDKHHVKIDVKKRVIWVKKTVTKAVRFIKDSCRKQEHFLNLIGDYITLFNYIPPTSVKAEYYMTKDEITNRRQTRPHISKLAPQAIAQDEKKSKQAQAKKRKFTISNQESSRVKNYDHRVLQNTNRKQPTRATKKSKTQYDTVKEKILSKRKGCLHHSQNYDKQNLEKNYLKLNPVEDNISNVEASKELLCDHLKRKGANQELRDKYGLLPSGPNRNLIGKMDLPKPLEEQPIQSGSSHRNATSPIKPYSSVDNFTGNKCSDTDIKNSGALSLLSRTPVYHSFLESGMNGSQDPPAWFKTIFEVYKSEEMWKLQNFYSMHKEFVDCESKKLSVLKQIYEKLGK